MIINGINYEEITLHPRYAKPGDKVYSFVLDDEDNKIWQVFTVKYVSVSYHLMDTKEKKKLDRKIEKLLRNYPYSTDDKNLIKDLMDRRNKIERETGYIRSDELDSKFYEKDLMNCYTFIVTEEEYDKYGNGTQFKPYLLEISTCKLIKEI
jgi:hypothetical protein